MVLNNLVPEKMNIMILSSTVPEEIQYDKTEKWFSTNYTEKGTSDFGVDAERAYLSSVILDVPIEWLEGWQNVKTYPNFHLPEPNRFLTSEFNLLTYKHDLPQYPEKILNSDLIELWYKMDNKFQMPVAYMNFYFISPLAHETAIK